jgi:hypothetical protein
MTVSQFLAILAAIAFFIGAVLLVMKSTTDPLIFGFVGFGLWALSVGVSGVHVGKRAA